MEEYYYIIHGGVYYYLTYILGVGLGFFFKYSTYRVVS